MGFPPDSRVGTAASQHVLAYVAYGTDPLRRLDEVVGVEQASFGMLPAHQGLHGGAPAVRKGQDRLIVDDELAIVRRRRELPLEHHLGRVALQQPRLEDLDPGLALGFGRVHRHVGVMKKLLEVRLARCRGDANAGTDMRDPPADMHRGRNRRDDPLCDLRGRHGAGTGQQDGELVAAQTGAQVARAGGLTNA